MYKGNQSTEPLDLELLLKKIQRRDPDAEKEFINHFEKGIRFLLSRLCNNQQVEEDLFQDTFMIVFQKIHNNKILEPTRISYFILQTARNLFMNEKRKKKHVFLEPQQIEKARSDLSGEEHLETARSKKLIRDVIQILEPQRDRDVIYQYYILEHTKEQICDNLQISDELFRRVLHRARLRFGKLWKKLSPEQNEK